MTHEADERVSLHPALSEIHTVNSPDVQERRQTAQKCEDLFLWVYAVKPQTELLNDQRATSSHCSKCSDHPPYHTVTQADKRSPNTFIKGDFMVQLNFTHAY